MTFNLDVSKYEGWKMGDTSSCINDIDNDDFIPIFNIEEIKQNEKISPHSMNGDELKPQKFVTYSSKFNSLNQNESLAVPLEKEKKNMHEMKSSGSDVSISFFLDRDYINDIYDEHTFANVNADVDLE